MQPLVLTLLGGCFPAGTRITMADCTTAVIESISAGDCVLSVDADRPQLLPWQNPANTIGRIGRRAGWAQGMSWTTLMLAEVELIAVLRRLEERQIAPQGA